MDPHKSTKAYTRTHLDLRTAIGLDPTQPQSGPSYALTIHTIQHGPQSALQFGPCTAPALTIYNPIAQTTHSQMHSNTWIRCSLAQPSTAQLGPCTVEHKPSLGHTQLSTAQLEPCTVMHSQAQSSTVMYSPVWAMHSQAQFSQDPAQSCTAPAWTRRSYGKQWKDKGTIVYILE